MDPINITLSSYCKTLRDFDKTKNYNDQEVYAACVKSAMNLLGYCKLAMHLSLHECKHIRESIQHIDNCPHGDYMVHLARKIQRLITPPEAGPWPTVLPKPFISNSIPRPPKNEPLDIQLDLERLSAVISFLKKYRYLLDPSYKKDALDSIKLKIIRSLFHHTSPFYWNFSVGLFESLPNKDPLITAFFFQKQNYPLYEKPQAISKKTLKDIKAIRLSLIKELFSILPKNEECIGIIGAGPAGILRALTGSLMGYKVLLLEKRPHHLHRNNERNNTLVLGHEETADLEILSCLGIWDRLIESDALTPVSGYQLFSTGYYLAISDLEKKSLEVLEELFPETLHPDVLEFHLQSLPHQQLQVGFNGQFKAIDALVICDGAHSSTLNNLRIKRIKYTQNAHALTAFFERKIPSIPLQNSPCSEADKQQTTRKYGVLLRHKLDYLGSALTEEQKNTIDAKPEAARQDSINNMAKNIYTQILKVIYAEELPPEEVSPLSAALISLKMKQTATSLFYHENVPILIRGDAYGTVHPASGYGAKTAIESLQADSFFFAYFRKGLQNEEINHNFASWAELFLLKAQQKSFFRQAGTSTHFDKPPFFLTLAEKRNLLDAKEKDHLLSLIVKRKYEMDLKDDIPLLLALKKKIIVNYWSRFGNTGPLFDEKQEPSPWLWEQSKQWVSWFKQTYAFEVISTHNFSRLFDSDAKKSDNRLRSYATTLFALSMPEEKGKMDMASLLGTLGWIDYALDIIPKSDCVLL